jgi:hypothetical protein
MFPTATPKASAARSYGFRTPSARNLAEETEKQAIAKRCETHAFEHRIMPRTYKLVLPGTWPLPRELACASTQACACDEENPCDEGRRDRGQACSRAPKPPPRGQAILAA